MNESKEMTGDGASGGAKSRTLTYLVVAALLTLLTAMEVSVAYIAALGSARVPLLIVLSGTKLALVVMFYMHLRYDRVAYSIIFLPVLLLAIGITVYLLILMMLFRGELGS